jgi:single-strand DNA-binding protein
MSEREINRVLLSGRLAGEPELRELGDGGPVCFLRLACADPSRRPGGSRRRFGEIDVLITGIRARRIARYLYRGRRLVVQGSLQIERWEAGEGPEHEAMCVLADRVCFVGRAPSGVCAREWGGDWRARDVTLDLSAASGFSEEMWC